jgi:bifunctional aspartokinase / homoserine dehydrogenase 1
MKFGGTSVGDRERLQHVATLVAKHDGPCAVVVSAIGKTTDHLLTAANHAEHGDWVACQRVVDELRGHHIATTDDPDTHVMVQQLLAELLSVLRGISLLREQTDRSRALVMSFGERMSAEVLASWIRKEGRPAAAVDAREMVRTDDGYLAGKVDLEATWKLAHSVLSPLLDREVVPVVTGFIAATSGGITTTLGRSGSDYTGALVGAMLEATEIWIWTDVDGILTADPRLVKEARTLQQVSYREAAEMSYFGARVLHPKTMLPAMAQGIPIRIRSTFTPESPGTLVTDTAPSVPQGVKTVTSIQDVALVTVDGRGMSGIVGIARRIFECTEAADVNVVMISQASSEQTVSLVVPRTEVGRLERVMQERFSLELRAGLIERIAIRNDIAVLSIIGQGMAGTPGVSGALFGALGGARVNILAIAQGASEMSISVAVSQADTVPAVRAVHTAFGLTRVVALAMVGCGRVGQQLLSMLEGTRERLAAEMGVELRLVAIANSRRLLIDEHGLDPDSAIELLNEAPVRPSNEEVVERLLAERFTDLVLVDVSAASLAPLHRAALHGGISVVTANKVPLSESYQSYRALADARAGSGVRYEYETTFGAGLPVLHTLKEMIHTGDTMKSVKGCFSGTLGFLCTRLQEGMSLQDAVGEAESLGYTEPDPREDLSGRDVARKALIIARALGRSLEPEDVELEPLVPGLENGLAQALEKHAPLLAAEIRQAAEAGEVLRYVAEVDEDGARVGLRRVPRDGPIGSLTGPDNMLVITTRRYDHYPMVIRGPGAGAEVTAAGVLGDVLKVARR